jgi:hypothetical protein
MSYEPKWGDQSSKISEMWERLDDLSCVFSITDAMNEMGVMLETELRDTIELYPENTERHLQVLEYMQAYHQIKDEWASKMHPSKHVMFQFGAHKMGLDIISSGK